MNNLVTIDSFTFCFLVFIAGIGGMILSMKATTLFNLPNYEADRKLRETNHWEDCPPDWHHWHHRRYFLVVFACFLILALSGLAGIGCIIHDLM